MSFEECQKKFMDELLKESKHRTIDSIISEHYQDIYNVGYYEGYNDGLFEKGVAKIVRIFRKRKK